MIIVVKENKRRDFEGDLASTKLYCLEMKGKKGDDRYWGQGQCMPHAYFMNC